MESNPWNAPRLSTASSRRLSSRSDLFFGGGFEESDGADDSRTEFLCPFCAEDFDIVGLFCHIDEDHPVEAKNGVCPVCTKRVGTDIVCHITTQHGSFFKVQRRRRLRRGASNSTFSLLRKELREGNWQSLLGGPPSFVSSSNSEPDPLLSSFIFNSLKVDDPVSPPSLMIEEATPIKESLKQNSLERNVQPSHLSDQEQEEKARKSEFVRGLVLSTIFDDYS